MTRILAVLYGAAGYLAAVVTIAYAVGFVGDIAVPKTIDGGLGPAAAGPLGQALLVDIGLLALFAIQHSGMARRGFKRIWTRVVPPPVERSTYVWFSSGVLALLYWQWQPLPQRVWDVDADAGRAVLWALFGLGWLLAFISIHLIDSRELFGLRQVHAFLKRRPPEPVPFKTPQLYRLVRHPLYIGLLLAFWATPGMSLGHLLFAAMTTGYILVAVQLEERDLVNAFGEDYRRYQQRVPQFLPRLHRGRTLRGARRAARQ